jgi:SPP1 family phage portal protein
MPFSITPEELKKYISRDGVRQRGNAERRKYFSGQHPGIFEAPAKDEPDNRIPVPFARKAIKTVKGYMFQPGNINYCGDNWDAYKDIYEMNSEPLSTAALAESAMTFGAAYELHWTIDKEKYFYEVPIDEIIPIYDDTILKRPVAFIRYYYINDMNTRQSDVRPDAKENAPIPSGPVKAFVYDDVMVTEYYAKSQGDVYMLVSQTPHGYGAIPVIEFNIDLKKKNLFDHVIHLIDWYDKMTSEDLADEVSRFANTLR